MTPFDFQESHHPMDLDAYYQGRFRLYAYARHALFDLLKQTGVKRLYLPWFICRDILSAVNQLAIECFFYDTDDRLAPCLENVRADAVLMVNYFGFPQMTAPFSDWCQRHNAFLIEDNAHGFLSRDTEGRLLGTRGDVGLFSFRKTVFLANGSGLLVNNPAYQSLPFEPAVLKPGPEQTGHARKRLLKKMIHALSPSLGMAVLRSRRLIRKIRTGSRLPLPDPGSEHRLPEYMDVAPALTGNRVKINPDREAERRRGMYRKVLGLARSHDIRPVFPRLEKGTVPMLFPFRAGIREKNKFEKHLFSQHFFVTSWPDLPEAIQGGASRPYTKIWTIPFLW